MKTNKKQARKQRQVIERKLRPWLHLRREITPPSGWIKAIRGSLGITTRQLAEHLGLNHSAILQLEKREAKGTASIEALNNVAEAMGCKLIYAVVPKEPNGSLEEILDEKAKGAAREILKRVEHTMRLEAQGSSSESSKAQLEELAAELKGKGDSRLWDKKIEIKTKKKKSK